MNKAQHEKRLQRDYRLLQSELPPGIICTPQHEQLNLYEARIDGPSDTPYQGGRFFLTISLPTTYPIDPPSVRFKTQIYHPNIDDFGNICLDILKTGNHGGWKPSWSLANVLISMTVLLSSPNPHDALMPEIADQMLNDHGGFMRTAKEWTSKFARAHEDDPEEYMPPEEEENKDVPAVGKKRKLGLARKNGKDVLPPPPGKLVTVGGKKGKMGMGRTVNRSITQSSSQMTVESIEVESDECQTSRIAGSMKKKKKSSKLSEILSSKNSGSVTSMCRRPLKLSRSATAQKKKTKSKEAEEDDYKCLLTPEDQPKDQGKEPEPVEEVKEDNSKQFSPEEIQKEQGLSEDQKKNKSMAKGKEPECIPVQPRRTFDRKDGDSLQILYESDFGPLDLGLPPVTVSAQRHLMRRKARP